MSKLNKFLNGVSEKVVSELSKINNEQAARNALYNTSTTHKKIDEVSRLIEKEVAWAANVSFSRRATKRMCAFVDEQYMSVVRSIDENFWNALFDSEFTSKTEYIKSKVSFIARQKRRKRNANLLEFAIPVAISVVALFFSTQ